MEQETGKEQELTDTEQNWESRGTEMEQETIMEQELKRNGIDMGQERSRVGQEAGMEHQWFDTEYTWG